MIESAVPHTVMPVKSLGTAADPTKVPPLPPMLMVDVVRYVPGGKNSTSPSFIALRALWIEVVQSFLSSPTAPNDSKTQMFSLKTTRIQNKSVMVPSNVGH